MRQHDNSEYEDENSCMIRYGSIITKKLLDKLIDGLQLFELVDDFQEMMINGHQFNMFYDPNHCHDTFYPKLVNAITLTNEICYRTDLEYARKIWINPDSDPEICYLTDCDFELNRDSVSHGKVLPLNELFNEIFKEIDDTMLIKIIMINGMAIRYVEQKRLTDQLLLLAVSSNGNILRLIEKDRLNRTIVLCAIKNNGLALEYVKPELIDKEIVLEALRENSRALQFVPPSMITEEMIMIAATIDFI